MCRSTKCTFYSSCVLPKENKYYKINIYNVGPGLSWNSPPSTIQQCVYCFRSYYKYIFFLKTVVYPNDNSFSEWNKKIKIKNKLVDRGWSTKLKFRLWLLRFCIFDTIQFKFLPLKNFKIFMTIFPVHFVKVVFSTSCHMIREMYS